MFQKEYTFYGTHAEQVKSLTSKFSDFSGSTLFQRNVDVLIIAPIVGLLFGRMGEIEKSTQQTTKIFVEQMIKEDFRIKFNYQLVTLIDKKSDNDSEKRINSAFRTIGSEESNNEITRFNAYILGGVEVLFEKLIQPTKSGHDNLANLFDFLEDINDRYNEAIKSDRISELLALARNQEIAN